MTALVGYDEARKTYVMVVEDGNVVERKDIEFKEFVERALGMYNLGRMQLGIGHTGEVNTCSGLSEQGYGP